MVSCIPEDNMTQDTIVPSSKNTVYTIRVDVELRHDGQHAQQQLTAVGQQQQANCVTSIYTQKINIILD